jgi:hypothetical protein
MQCVGGLDNLRLVDPYGELGDPSNDTRALWEQLFHHFKPDIVAFDTLRAFLSVDDRLAEENIPQVQQLVLWLLSRALEHGFSLFLVQRSEEYVLDNSSRVALKYASSILRAERTADTPTGWKGIIRHEKWSDQPGQDIPDTIWDRIKAPGEPRVEWR